MPPETKALYEFGKFRCDPREHLLLCAGKPVSLSPKSFEILVALIQSNGRLLTKDELMQQVWPDSFVEEANLTVNISALRKVLGETPGGQRYIETVPKRGYRFVAPVTERQDDGKPSPSMQPSGVEQGDPLLAGRHDCAIQLLACDPCRCFASRQRWPQGHRGPHGSAL